MQIRQFAKKSFAFLREIFASDIFNLVLADFAKHFQVGKHKQILLTMDQAGWHTSKELKVPEGIHILLMPSHSPELQPAQRLWPLTNEAIALLLMLFASLLTKAETPILASVFKSLFVCLY